MLLEQCKQNLNEFPDSFEHDLEILKKDNLTYNERNCIILRVGEKRVYNFLIKFCTKVIDALNGKGKVEENRRTKPYLISIAHLLYH